MAQSESAETSGRKSQPVRRQAPSRVRRWPVDVKRRIVEETFVPGSSVSIVARRHDVNANQVFTWRQKYWRGELGQGAAKLRADSTDFIPVGVVVSSAPAMKPLSLPSPAPKSSCEPKSASPRTVPESTRGAGVIEIALRGGIKLRVDAGIDDASLRRVLTAVRDIR